MTFPELKLGDWTAKLRGRLTPNQLLSEITWFRVGGPAQLFFQPADEEDLAFFLKNLPEDIRVTTLGLGSNLLIRDGGLDGVVIRLSARGFGAVEVLDDHRLRVGTALPDLRVATAAAEAGIDGLTFYSGIPGGIGGALYMNAGCYGTETRDRMVELRAVTRQGEIVTLTNADMDYLYRKSNGSARRGVRLGGLSGRAGRAGRRSRRGCAKSPKGARRASRSAPRPADRPSRIRMASRAGS